MKTLKISSLKLKSPIILAPMVDVTDLPYRLICRKQGAALAYTEMLYIDAILHKNPRTLSLMKTNKEDSPVGIQITGNSPEEFKKFSPFAKPFNLVDINCGCPSVKITGNQAGSYLLKNPNKIAQMIKILKKEIPIVTAKIRLGYKINNALKIAKFIEKAGADALTIHTRLATQGASIPADHNQTKLLKSKIGIPLIANGDIFTPQKAEELLDITDGIMIARGAIGNPLIFKKMIHYFKTKKILNIKPSQNLTQFQKYLKLANKYKILDLNRIKYLASNFTKGIRHASLIRQKISQIKSIQELNNLMKKVKISTMIHEELDC